MGLYFLCLYKLSSERVVHSKWICVVAVWIIIARSAGVKDFEMIRVICFRYRNCRQCNNLQIL